MNKVSGVAALLLTWSLSAQAAAETPTSLAQCRAIVGDAERLACYDALSEAPAGSHAGFASQPAGRVPVPAQSVPETMAPLQQTVREPERIESKLKGRFDHFQPKMEFQLENGQVWTCLAQRREDFNPVDDPSVVIKRNFAGHYYMLIEGIYRQFPVRRSR